jgi:monooxygenase
MEEAAAERLDVLIIGAGISGIDAAYHIQTQFPAKRYAILEARDALGGTWDFFRYPGVRSDSDMHTLGFPFNPWHGEASIADGASIRDYIRETAVKFSIEPHIRLKHRMLRASWLSERAHWLVEAAVAGSHQPVRFVCRFLYACTGYYDYKSGFQPEFSGSELFRGQLLHPQNWPAQLDYAGKRIVVIGSGATAVTLVPALAEKAAHVIMLQRSPSYIVSRAAKDSKALWLYRYLPKGLAAKLIKWKNVGYGIVMFHLARSKPKFIKGMLIKDVRKALGAAYEVDRHFTPRYNPWDQRICLVPDGDLFTALRAGRAQIVTDTIDTFVETGIRLSSGAILPADIVVSATGLVMTLMGGAEICIDGVPIKFHERMLYKGVMFSGVPNFAIAFGYTNASWTLRCDLSARYVCRLLKYMDREDYSCAMPSLSDPAMIPEPLLDFSSGYVRRGNSVLPRQGQKAPWRVRQNYFKDWASFVIGSVNDGTMKFCGEPTSLADAP